MTDFHARIAVRAYFAWEAAGRPEGQHEAHWLAAEWIEREIAEQAERGALTALAFGINAEQAKADKRSAAAKKAAATRKANKERAAITVAAITAEKRAHNQAGAAH